MTATPNVHAIDAAVLAKFPDARFGHFNCRLIGSGSRWSQHAASEPAKRYFGNGSDVTHQKYGYSSHPLHQIWLLRVKAFIKAKFPDTVRLLLAPGNRNHADHLHFDCWPKMKDTVDYVPPCKGGTLVVVYADGSTAATFGELTTPPPPPPEEDTVLQNGDEGRAVTFYQEALIEWGIANGTPALPGDGADGVYGDETVTWVRHFQFFWDLDLTGVIDGVTSDLLGDYHLTRESVQGDTGDTGDAGPRGMTGAPGLDGADGLQGEPGPQPTSSTFGYDD